MMAPLANLSVGDKCQMPKHWFAQEHVVFNFGSTHVSDSHAN